MGMQNEQEWAEAQTITVSIDLIEAAKKQLKFLAAVDRNRFLYDGHALERAIYRYNAYWLPLLAKHLENSVSEEPLVVPLDCEWIWHCHRLNPIRYKIDCEKFFGRILDNDKIISSVEMRPNAATKKIWDELYPEEPYELDLSRPFSEDLLHKKSQTEKFTSYDLVAAVKRQAPFFFQVSQPHMMDELFLKEAAARYKGFLHLVRINRKMSLKRLCVPTYDIDLMWHTHQLYPVFYCKDMSELVGSVVQHDDTVADRAKGGKLDNGQFQTTRQWEDTFRSSYWRAGATYRGTAPSPVTQVPYKFNVECDELNASEKCGQEIQCPTVKTTEVLLEFVDIKNVPVERKENLLVLFSKKNPDKLLNTKGSLGISSNYEDKQVALFQCEPNGEFLFELMSRSSSNEPLRKSLELLGSCSISLEEMFSCRSQLATKKWVSVDLVPGLENSEPVLLCVSISYTPPTPAPQLFQLVRTGVQTHVLNYDDKKVFTLQTRNVVMDAPNCTSPFEKEVYCVTDSGEKHTLLEFHGNYWSIKGTQGSFKLQTSPGNDESLFELTGYKMVKLFPGRRLEFESKQSKNLRPEQEFITAVEFSVDNPYGKAVALIDKKFETIKATEEWIVLAGISMAFILAGTHRKDGQISQFSTESRKEVKSYESNGARDGKVEAAALCAGQCVDIKNVEIVENGINGTGPCISPCGNKAKIGEDGGGEVEVTAQCCTECTMLFKEKCNCGPCTIYVCEDGAGLLDLPMQASSVSNNNYVKCDGDDAAGVLNMSNVVYGK